MKAGKLFKSFIPYVLDDTFFVRMNKAFDREKYLAKDPSGGQWRDIGLMIRLDTAFERIGGQDSLMCFIRFNERMLPAKVRDEKLTEKVATLEAQIGRKVGKKEYAELREQVEFDLLPQAFIKRTDVPVMFIKATAASDSMMLIFTSSQKKADDITSFLVYMLNADGYEFKAALMQPENNVTERLTAWAKNGADGNFAIGSDAVLKGVEEDNRKTVRVKDLNIESSEIQALLKQQYMVTELGVRHCDDELGEELFSFKVNGKFVFKGLVFPDSTVSGEKGADLEQAFQSHAWIVAQLLRSMLVEMTAEMGGQQEVSFIDSNELADEMKKTADEMNAFADTGLLPPDENGVAWVGRSEEDEFPVTAPEDLLKPFVPLDDLIPSKFEWDQFVESSEESLDEDDDDSL